MLIIETKMLDGTVLHRQTDEIDAYHAIGYAIEFGWVDPELVESVSCDDGDMDAVARPREGLWVMNYGRRGGMRHEIAVPWRE